MNCVSSNSVGNVQGKLRYVSTSVDRDTISPIPDDMKMCHGKPPDLAPWMWVDIDANDLVHVGLAVVLLPIAIVLKARSTIFLGFDEILRRYLPATNAGTGDKSGLVGQVIGNHDGNGSSSVVGLSASLSKMMLEPFSSEGRVIDGVRFETGQGDEGHDAKTDGRRMIGATWLSARHLNRVARSRLRPTSRGRPLAIRPINAFTNIWSMLRGATRLTRSARIAMMARGVPPIRAWPCKCSPFALGTNQTMASNNSDADITGPQPITSGLGSLAQSARTGQLKAARGSLIAIGVLTIVVNVIFLFMAEGKLNSEVEKLQQQGVQVDMAAVQQAVLLTRIVNGTAAALGVVFIFLGMIVYRAPVMATVTGLVLYIGAAVAFGLLDPATVASGLIVKAIIVVGLFRAVQAAFAYQREQRVSGAAAFGG